MQFYFPRATYITDTSHFVFLCFVMVVSFISAACHSARSASVRSSCPRSTARPEGFACGRETRLDPNNTYT